jgi:hypothetical protein
MIFINGVAFEKLFNIVWIVSCTAPLHRTYTIVSAEQQYLCSTYFASTGPFFLRQKYISIVTILPAMAGSLQYLCHYCDLEPLR